MTSETPDSELPISLKGQLLLATPSLHDGTFDHSVIFLAEHSSKSGAFGSIINHPADTNVGEVVPHLSSTPLASIPVYRGGPVGTQQLTFSSICLLPNSSVSFQPQISAEAATKAIKNKNYIVQATIGHSAWAPGQLENEILRNTWITLRPIPSLLSEPLDPNLWKKLLSSISPYHALLAHAPKNPLLN